MIVVNNFHRTATRTVFSPRPSLRNEHKRAPSMQVNCSTNNFHLKLKSSTNSFSTLNLLGKKNFKRWYLIIIKIKNLKKFDKVNGMTKNWYQNSEDNSTMTFSAHSAATQLVNMPFIQGSQISSTLVLSIPTANCRQQ